MTAGDHTSLDLRVEVDLVAAETSFSGVVRVDREGRETMAAAYGFADRASGVPNQVDTVFGVASGAKAFTALTIMSLVESGDLALATTVRSVLGPDLPLIDRRVTVEHLLGHRSGIGDYLDEHAGLPIDAYLMTRPLRELDDVERYLPMLDHQPQVHEPDERFEYNNSGYAVLAVIAQRVGGIPFPELVEARVCRPAGLEATAFLRSDELPPGVAVGYLHAEGLRTNVLHLPVRGSGDGGIFTTGADVHQLWDALFAHGIVSKATVEAMVRPRSTPADGSFRYGLGFWLHPSRDVALIEGHDAGVSFRSVRDPANGLTHTVLSNTSEGAWPMTRRLGELLGTTS
jgi:CubicO group peptidase (beta-lactamase class C family)